MYACIMLAGIHLLEGARFGYLRGDGCDDDVVGWKWHRVVTSGGLRY
jgi:hypothetical protein